MGTDQKHLDFKSTVNLGSFYTPPSLVKVVFDLLKKNGTDTDRYIIIDSSCGYGSFLQGKKVIGVDIDAAALEQAAKAKPHARLVHANSLLDVRRSRYGMSGADKIIIVGNPPYNDRTSCIRNRIKQDGYAIDDDIKSRDLGLSFLLSYNKLQADYVCVLHPLSYLIKKTNFNVLQPFAAHYRLIDSVLISSAGFSQTSRITQFPIIGALYKRTASAGMDYGFIQKWLWKTIDGKAWNLKQFDTINNYIAKYPNARRIAPEKAVGFFWSLRDINALKRSKTFVEKESCNTIRITQEQFPYYCYIDIFKDYIRHIPYYFGNCNIFIDNDNFITIKELFVQKACSKYPFLSRFVEKTTCDADTVLNDYFRRLLKDHYLES
ncbi:MAG: SAM-dependent methyltransferase [Spirochaetaceae bacterium]|jgi:hypothetical protein|nr:SAM-dependent methyltransferase [Spirochaetaceae bacterium]